MVLYAPDTRARSVAGTVAVRMAPMVMSSMTTPTPDPNSAPNSSASTTGLLMPPATGMRMNGAGNTTQLSVNAPPTPRRRATREVSAAPTTAPTAPAPSTRPSSAGVSPRPRVAYSTKMAVDMNPNTLMVAVAPSRARTSREWAMNRTPSRRCPRPPEAVARLGGVDAAQEQGRAEEGHGVERDRARSRDQLDEHAAGALTADE